MGCPYRITASQGKPGTLVFFVAGGGRWPCRGSGKPPLPHNSPPSYEAYHPPGRSTEEIIALFISITFVLDAVKGMVKSECT